jgi:hypothetical protein
MRSRLLLICGLALFIGAGCRTHQASSNRGVQITNSEKGLFVSIGGQPFTEYVAEGLSRPALYPLLGPGQTPMTRKWPFEQNTPDEEHDHPHHLSVWFEHEVNKNDFWTEGKGAGKTVQVKVLKVKSGRDEGVIQTTNHWVAASGRTVATDQRTLTFYDVGPDARMFDYEITIFAAQDDLVFADTKEGTMAIRIAESMRLMRHKKPAAGHIVLSTGVTNDDAWGKRADWCDYYGPNGGKTLGIAMFDHPDNLRHPTWWHVRDYGLLAANPFGLHDFEKKPAGTGEFKLPRGQSLTFRYRIYIHEGDTQQARVSDRYEEYKKSRSPGRKSDHSSGH